jgi:hypothetical protein
MATKFSLLIRYLKAFKTLLDIKFSIFFGK